MRVPLLALLALNLTTSIFAAAQANTRSGGNTKPSSAPGATYEQVVLELIAKEGVEVPFRLKTNWDKDSTCSENKCKGNQVTDRKDPEKCRDCSRGQKPNAQNEKCIRDDTGCAEDEVQKDDKTCDRCPGNQISDNTGKKCVDVPDCTGKQSVDPDDNSKCKDCPSGQIPGPGNTRCMREDTGCADDEIQKDDKSCERCDDGKKGDKDGKACVDQKKSGGKQGRCPNGQVLNPAKGGQDENTENPSCIPDDDSKCENGQTAGTRTKKQASSNADVTPKCGTDDKPDFECRDSNLYHHKKVNDDGKIEHSCRTTEKTEDDKKKNYQDRVKNPSGQTPDSKDKDEKSKKKRRARGGWCFVELASMGIWDGPDLENLPEEEIDGLVELAIDQVPTPADDSAGGEIPDYVVTLKQESGPLKVVADPVDSLDSAGIGTWIAGLFGAAARSVPKVIKNAPQGAQRFVRELRSGSRAAASAKAIDKAKQSKFVDRVLKSQEFRECVGSVALTGASAAFGNFEVKGAGDMSTYSLVVDWSHTDPGTDWLQPPEFEKVVLKGMRDRHVDGEGRDPQDSVNQLNFWRETRTNTRNVDSDFVARPTKWQMCDTFSGRDRGMIGQLSWIEVHGGCCAFYSTENCAPSSHLFDMDRREDRFLKGASNDAIQGWWCSAKCDGRP